METSKVANLSKDGIERIDHFGKLIPECQLEGERRSNQVVPAHPSGIQLSKDRWLLLYATRMFRGNDDDTSIVYQIRENTPDGRLIKEAMMQRSINDWDALGDGKGRFVKQHGHPCVFGVPQGAKIGGKPAKSANIFVLLWRMVAREFDPIANAVEGTNPDPELVNHTSTTEWTQVRLSEDGNDIEIIEEIRQLRQVGYGDSGPIFCNAEDAAHMVQGYTPPVPYNKECTEWTFCNHFDQARFAALKFRFDVSKGRYEWVETGPYLFAPRSRHSDASLAPYGDSWVCAVRTDFVVNHVSYEKGLKWVRMDDPFSQPPEPVYYEFPGVKSPKTVYFCPDGVLRLFSSDCEISPYGNRWDPLYCWNIDPDNNFEASNQRVVFDTVKAGLPFRRETRPKADMCKLLFHNGNTQYIIHRVSAVSMKKDHIHTDPEPWVFPAINEEEMANCAIYGAKIIYREAYPQHWELDHNENDNE